MKSSENTLAALLAIEGNQWHFHIPRFQREYVWKKNNWNKLLEDIYEDETGHYMGSIICVHETDELTPGAELIYEMVDGQQRITTLSLLLAAIFERMGELGSKDRALRTSEEFIIIRNGIKKRLVKEVKLDSKKLPWGIFRSGSLVYCLRVQPSTQEQNLDDYQYILHEVGLLPEATRPQYVGNRRLYKAFDFFRQQIPTTLPELHALLDRIYALLFIHITEASQSKAFMLFETLNYRGVPLSAIDIIKNKMLATLENKHGMSIDSAYDRWQKLLEYLPEDRDQDRFLRQFYNAFKLDPKVKIEKIGRATASNVIEIYEHLIKADAKHIFEELARKAKIYNQFIEPEEYAESRLISALVELERIGAAPAYTFLLYLFSLGENAFGERHVKESTVELLGKYYFRRNVTDYPSTRDLDSINIELVEKCQKEVNAGRRLSFDFISRVILRGRGRPSTLKELRAALADDLFYNNENMARYALARLDESHKTREYAPNFWARNDKGQYLWTVEHIFPQGKHIPADWVRMVAKGDRQKAESIQGEWVHCLGNLTLTGYNSKLSNQAFEKKQAKDVVSIFGTKLKIGFKNGLALNNIQFSVRGRKVTLATTSDWNQESIEARNTVMVDMLVKLFKFDGE